MGSRPADPRRQSDRPHPRPRRSRRRDGAALVGDEIRMGRPPRRERARDRGALRLVRPAAVRRRLARVRLGRAETRLSEYDPIARLYDPWSSSVVEDISFYVDEALAAEGPVVELGV